MDFCGMEKLSLVDYNKKICAVVFMAGCPFRCPFCHNGDLVLHPERAEPIPFAEILDYLEKRKGVLDGVVVSGGEPTLMPDLEEKLIALKNLGYDVKLDSNGVHPEILRHLIENKRIDYIAMDIKNSKGKYPLTCGAKVDMNAIEESVRLIMESGIDYEFRTTIVDEYHDVSDMVQIAEWIKGARRYVLQQFKDSPTCIKANLHSVSQEKFEEFVRVLRGNFGELLARGYDLPSNSELL